MKYFLILSFFVLSIPCFSQNSSVIKGVVIDTITRSKINDASISVISAQDSVLIAYTWTNMEGRFQINNIPEGNFILLVSYPDFAEYWQNFKVVNSKANMDLGEVKIVKKINLLKEVIIKGNISAIKIKGDTTEFNASSYVIQPNANVEELLRQLPGIQIDNNGKITANGRIVRKVLVDGEEFFGDDPTLVTRNLRGDMISKVQLFDKKSDQASFSGIDDGIREKTINLKLKEDKKKGLFGKAEAGIGTKAFFQNQVMFNLFRSKYKFATYGNLGNTGRVGLSSSENGKYGTASGGIEFVQGGISVPSFRDDVETSNGKFSGQGIPLSKTAGFHYDGKLNNDLGTINSNYKIGSLEVRNQRMSSSQNDLPNGSLINNSSQSLFSSTFRQKVDASYFLKTSQTSNLKVAVDGIIKRNEQNNKYIGQGSNENGLTLNTGTRTISNTSNQKGLSISSVYSKKLKKDGRTIIWNLTGTTNNDDTRGYLYAINHFFNTDGQIQSTQLVDQLKTVEISSQAVNNNILYSEPISKSLNVGVNYRFGFIRNTNHRNSFNKSSTGDYDELDTEFSSDFLTDQFSNQGGAIFNYSIGKKVITFGTRITGVSYNQTNRMNEEHYKRDFLNWAPLATFRLQVTPQKLIQVGYYGNTIQPSIEQIQPIQVNTDPLNIIIGNPQLQPAFKNDITGSFYAYRPLYGFLININASYGIVNNPIVSSVITDASGASVYQFINLVGKSTDNFFIRADFNKQVKKINSNISLSLTYNGSDNYGVSNYVVNRRNYQTYNVSFGITGNKSKAYDYNFRLEPKVFRSNSTLQSQLSNNGNGLEGQAGIAVYLPGKVEIRTDAVYNYQSKTEVFTNSYEALIINASVVKKILKNESLKMTISGNDIFNQNIGFSRVSSGTIISQSTYDTISRYFMFTLAWDFSKFGKIDSKK